MGKDKYYIPQIEEFHVGFEYETNYLKDDWEKQVLTAENSGYFFETYKTDAVNVEFRVKFLDREDIESFGFKKSNLNPSIFTTNEKRRFSDSNEYHLGLNHAGTGVSIFWIIGNNPSAFPNIFVGHIKNKSELKRVMKQLNIE